VALVSRTMTATMTVVACTMASRHRLRSRPTFSLCYQVRWPLVYRMFTVDRIRQGETYSLLDLLPSVTVVLCVADKRVILDLFPCVVLCTVNIVI
jgi:hypothetical protein